MQQATSAGIELPLLTESFEICFDILDSLVSGLPKKTASGAHDLAHLSVGFGVSGLGSLGCSHLIASGVLCASHHVRYSEKSSLSFCSRPGPSDKSHSRLIAISGMMARWTICIISPKMPLDAIKKTGTKSNRCCQIAPRVEPDDVGEWRGTMNLDEFSCIGYEPSGSTLG